MGKPTSAARTKTPYQIRQFLKRDTTATAIIQNIEQPSLAALTKINAAPFRPIAAPLAVLNTTKNYTVPYRFGTGMMPKPLLHDRKIGLQQTPLAMQKQSRLGTIMKPKCVLHTQNDRFGKTRFNLAKTLKHFSASSRLGTGMEPKP